MNGQSSIKDRVAKIFTEWRLANQINETNAIYEDLAAFEKWAQNDIVYKAPESHEFYLKKYAEMINMRFGEHDISKYEDAFGGSKVKYNGKVYKVHIGSRGGKYIIVGKDKKKVYV